LAEQAQVLTGDAAWPSVDALSAAAGASRSQLLVVWEAFQSALALTVAAAQDGCAPAPVPVWADELRQARGLPAEAADQRAGPRQPSPRSIPRCATRPCRP
jgi:predicted NBD/HSP70 family sugar kinase